MEVAVTGSHGMIGSAVVPALTAAGHRVRRLVRSDPGPGDVLWDPEAGTIDAAGLEGVEGAIHLAGVGIGEKRWTAAEKARIRDSRIQGTTLLAETLARLSAPPRVLVSQSAVGYYGYDRGDEVLTEESTPGDGFLAGVVRDWEA
ncbi:MAG: NAD-dependent epimerase/dehydratase family protein, partial [Acidimicrobiales bacterium]